MQIVTFPNPGGLNAAGHNLFETTQASGDPSSGQPGREGRGSLLQGSLEGSNVEVVNEMIGLIRTQRAYEINSKVVAAADEMLRNATQMR
jgi:flagellar basal-body rod protein FlgG